MQSAYEQFEDEVAILAINNYNDDTLSYVKSYIDQKRELASNGTSGGCAFTFDVAKGGEELAVALAEGFEDGWTGWPVSVVIDRYGVICLMEKGGMPSEKPFTAIFEYFTDPEYKQKLITDINELVPREKPEDFIDAEDYPTSEQFNSAVSGNGFTGTYYHETETSDWEYSWPFIIDEFMGETVIRPSNDRRDTSFATLHIDVTLEKGDVFAFDFFSDTEYGSDLMYVLVNQVDIYTISGESDEWQKCFAFVAEETADYTVTLLYYKDYGTDVGDDTVYIKNIRIVEEADIDQAAYIPRYAATKPKANGMGYEKYAHAVLNENDGYYHVCLDHEEGHTCDVNGPLLLAGLMVTTNFSNDETVYSMIYNSKYVTPDELTSYYESIVEYCGYSSNASLYGYCPVTEELAEFLKIAVEVKKSYLDDDNAWLQFCKYYQTYGTVAVDDNNDGEADRYIPAPELEDPIKGLAPFSAYPTVIKPYGENGDEYLNSVTYNRVIMPRGLLYKFRPEVSGVYRIVTQLKEGEEVNGWIFNSDKEVLLDYAHIDRFITDIHGVNMVMYFDNHTDYYIDIAYYDVYFTGTFTFTIEPVHDKNGVFCTSYEQFRAVSPGSAFTYALDQYGEVTSTLIPGGAQVEFCTADTCDKCDNAAYECGFPAGTRFYHEVRVNEDGVKIIGSVIYADLTTASDLLSAPIYNGGINTNLKDLITQNAFNFLLTAEEKEGLYYVNTYGYLEQLDDSYEAVGIKLYCERMAESLAKQLADGEITQEEYNTESAKYVYEDLAEQHGYAEMNTLELIKAYCDLAGISYTNLNGKYNFARLSSATFISDKQAEYDTALGKLRTATKTAMESALGRVVSAEEVDAKILKENPASILGDATAKVLAYVEKMYSGENEERKGCVPVTEELANILQALADCYTFKVTNSWVKFCYYYQSHNSEADYPMVNQILPTATPTEE